MEIIRVVTAESVRRTHDIGPLCCIHRTKNHTHTQTRVHTSRSRRRYFPGSRISRTQQSRALPDSCVDVGPRTVDIHPWRSRELTQFTASADLLAPRRQSGRLCFSVVRHSNHPPYAACLPLVIKYTQFFIILFRGHRRHIERFLSQFPQLIFLPLYFIRLYIISTLIRLLLLWTAVKHLLFVVSDTRIMCQHFSICDLRENDINKLFTKYGSSYHGSHCSKNANKR